MRQELGIIEESGYLNSKLGNQISEHGVSDKQPIGKIVEGYNGIIGSIDANENKNKEYLRTLEKNDNRVVAMRKKDWLMTGKSRKFFDSTLSLVAKYYDLEKKRAVNTSIDMKFVDLFFQTIRDVNIAMEYQARVVKMSETEISRTFGELVALEKYGKSSVVVDDAMIDRLPYGVSILNRYTDYLSSYYSVMRDVAKGDKESATYKARRVIDLSPGLSFDWDRIVEEPKEGDAQRTEETLEVSFDILTQIKKFQNDRMGRYPFLPVLDFTIPDVAYCQLLTVKSNLYKEIRSENPNYSSTDELIRSLSELYPKSNELDKQVDRSGIELIDGEKEVKVKCSDKAKGKVYEFILTKI